MTSLAKRNPQAFGVLVTLAGVMIFVPDALVMRLLGGRLGLFFVDQAGLQQLVA